MIPGQADGNADLINAIQNGGNPLNGNVVPGMSVGQGTGAAAADPTAQMPTGTPVAGASPAMYQGAASNPLNNPATMAGALAGAPTMPQSIIMSDPIASQMPGSLGNDLNPQQTAGAGMTPDAMGALMSPVPQNNSITNPTAFGGLGGGQ